MRGVGGWVVEVFWGKMGVGEEQKVEEEAWI